MIDSRVQAWEGPSRPLIVESWKRSESARVEPGDERCFRQVPPEELQRRQAAAAELLELAVPHLEWISRILAHEEVPHAIYVADRDGIVLWSAGTPREPMEKAGLLPGFDWSEAAMGTNGAGTSIVTGQPVVIRGEEHFARAWHKFTGMAAPLHASDGSVLGAISLSTSEADGRPERLLVIAHVAHVVDQALAQRSALREEVSARTRAEAAERALRESEERFRRAFDRAPIGMALVTPDFRMVRVNPAFARMLGFAPDELAGRTFAEVTHPEDVDRDAALAAKLFRGEIPSYKLEKRYLTRDGGQVWAALTASVFLDEAGRVTEGLAMIENVTAEREALEEIRKGHALLQGLLDETADAVLLSDTERRVLLVNRVACRMLGRPPEELLGRRLDDLLPAEYAERARRGGEKVISDGSVLQEQVELSVEGAPRDFLVLRAPYRDEERRVVGVINVARDITAWKEAERGVERLHAEALALQKRAIERLAAGSSLRELLVHLCQAVETGGVDDVRASILLQDAGRLRHAAAPSLPEEYRRAIDGLSIGPAVGSCGTAAFRRERVVVADIASDPLWDGWRELALKHGLAACWSTPILSRAGEVLGTFAVYSGRPRTPTEEETRRSDAFSHLAAVAIERERAESARDESERRFRAVTRKTLGLLSILSIKGEILDSNDSSLRMAGVGREEALGRFYWEVGGWAPELRGLLKSDVLQAARGQEIQREFAYATPGGDTRYVELVLSPVRDRRRKVGFVIAEGRDVTDRRADEERIRALNESLREANRRLEEHARRLQDSLQELQAFSYTIAHDLRAPLRAMAGFAQILLEDFPLEALGETGRNHLRHISGAAVRMDALIRDLLDFNNLSRRPVTTEAVDPAAALETVLVSMSEELRRRSAEVLREGPIPPVTADRGLLPRVLEQLLTNAVTFVAPGVRPAVRIRAQARDGRVRIWVEDNGIGIAPEHRARVFGVFDRLHRSSDYPGTGMGLAIVARAMERMNGRVGVESNVGNGSRFWIELPAATS